MEELEAYGGGSALARLGAVFEELQAYCSMHKLVLHMNALTRSLLGWHNSSDYPSGMLFLK